MLREEVFKLTDADLRSMVAHITGSVVDVLQGVQADTDGVSGKFTVRWQGDVTAKMQHQTPLNFSVDGSGAYKLTLPAEVEGKARILVSGEDASALLKDTVKLGVIISVTDAAEFADHFGQQDANAPDLQLFAKAMLCFSGDVSTHGVSSIMISDFARSGDQIFFEVVATVKDMQAMSLAGRISRYDCFGDNAWLPSTMREALFELALGSNDNPSPDLMGFAFVDYPDCHASDLRPDPSSAALMAHM